MNIFKLFLFFLFGLLVRRAYLSLRSLAKPGPSGPAQGPGNGSGNGPPPPGRAAGDLTEQDISDADFEEIP
jgi:hypothetical protein